MLDHLSIQCADIAASAAFYDAVLAPLGGARIMDFGDGHRLRHRTTSPTFWIGRADDRRREPRDPHRVRREGPRDGARVLRRGDREPAPRCCTSRACGPSTTRTTTARSSAIPTATTSRRYVTTRSDAGRRAGRDRSRSAARRGRWCDRRIPAAVVGGYAQPDRGLVLVAEIEGEPVGRVTVDTTYSDAGMSGFVVTEPRRREGIGTTLMDAAEAEALKQECDVRSAHGREGQRARRCRSTPRRGYRARRRSASARVCAHRRAS